MHPARLLLGTGALAVTSLAVAPPVGTRGLLYLFGGGILGEGAGWAPAAVLLGFTPVYAGLLELFHLRSERLYLDHVVFVLHLQSAAYLGMTAETLGAWATAGLPAVRDVIQSGFVFVVLLYAVLALHTAYGEDLGRTLAKATGLAILHAAGVVALVFLLV